ncbi:MAG: MarR family transcriptional regulator [Promethearchaeota archaeon]
MSLERDETEILKDQLKEKESAIWNLQARIGEIETALRTLNAEVKMKDEQIGKLNDKNAEFQKQLTRMEVFCDNLQAYAIRAVAGLAEGKRDLKELIREKGNLKHRILLVVNDSKQVTKEELVTELGIEETTLDRTLQVLKGEGLIKVGTDKIMSSAASTLKGPPVEKWGSLATEMLFDRFAEFCRENEESELVASAIERVADIVEERLKSYSPLIYQMRKEVEKWKNKTGSKEDLKNYIPDWRRRTLKAEI